jgi:uncharacterized protein YndB with AHSA1/START domain
MGEVVVSTHIEAPPPEVWAVALDPERLADWVTIHRSLGAHDEGEAREGFRMTQTLTLRGAPFKVHWELVTCDAPHEAVWHGKGPAGSRAETAYRLSEDGGGTLFEYRNEFFTPLGVLGRVAQRAVAGDIPRTEALASLERLRGICERGTARRP